MPELPSFALAQIILPILIEMVESQNPLIPSILQVFHLPDMIFP